MTFEDIFGKGDPHTGMIYANPLPSDFKPTPELEQIVEQLKHSTKAFHTFEVSLDRPEGYPYPTYLSSGNYLDQWVQRHTNFTLHHAFGLYGSKISVVLSRKEELPVYDENDQLMSGTTKEMFTKR